MKATLINDRIYLDIPYELKETVKAQGARFEPSKRQWWLEDTPEVRQFLKVNFFGMLTVGFAFKADEQDEQIVEERSPLPPLAENIYLYEHQMKGYHLAMNELNFYNEGGDFSAASPKSAGYAFIMDCG